MKLKNIIGRLKKKSASSESLPTAEAPDGKLIHVVSGFFSVDTTSTKAVDEIEKEVDKVLKELDPAKKWKISKKNYLYKIKFKDVTFEMEICQIDKLDFLRGIRF